MMKQSPSKIMPPVLLLQLFAVFLISIGSSVSADVKDFEDSSHVEYPAWFEDNPFYDLAEIIAEVSTDKKKGLMVLFTTKGCTYCEQFIKRSLGNPDIAQKAQNRFASIGMEIFDDAEMVTPTGETIPVKKFAKQQGVGFSPTLLFFDADGKRILRQIGYQAPERFLHLMNYVADKHYETVNLSEFIESKPSPGQNTSTYTQLKADSLFDEPPYALNRSKFAASEPLMVLFEKIGCGECEAFHNDVLQLKNVRAGLQNFQIVRMDVNDITTRVLLPNGKFTTPKKWYEESSFSRLPALMFFNETGKLSLKTDAYVLNNRMMNSINYMREKAYLKDWTYQQFARSKSIERSLQQEKSTKP